MIPTIDAMEGVAFNIQASVLIPEPSLDDDEVELFHVALHGLIASNVGDSGDRVVQLAAGEQQSVPHFLLEQYGYRQDWIGWVVIGRAVTQPQCTTAPFRAKWSPRCSVLICKTGSQQAVCHCTYTYGDKEVCSDPAPMGSKGQGKMQSPL
ncbi:TPA: hypothetical protein ACH3X1_016435 [Trebouxia sp. C0004]